MGETGCQAGARLTVDYHQVITHKGTWRDD